MLQLIFFGILYIIGFWALCFLLYKISPYIDNWIMGNTYISKMVLSIILVICIFKLPFYWYIILKIIIAYIFLSYAFNDKIGKNFLNSVSLTRDYGIKSFWFNLWTALTILYNPIYQIPLGKNLWIIVDVLTVLVLLWSMTIQNSKNERKTKTVENFNFKETVFKYFFDEDLFTFHDFENFDMINTKSVYHYEDLFNTEIEGVTTFFSIQEPNKLSYSDYYGRDYSRLENNTLFAVFIFDYINTYSTNYASGIQSLSFKKIEIYKKTSDNNVNLVDICNVEDLRN
jgi:hypothetical protein